MAFQGLRCLKWGGTRLQNPGPISENGLPWQGSYDTTHPACLQGLEGPAWAHVPMGPIGPMGSWGLPPHGVAWGAEGAPNEVLGAMKTIVL